MTLLYPCLMFRGEAEQAMHFYVGAFKGAEILELMRYSHGIEGDQHKVSRGIITLHNQTVLCFDSIVDHPFTFTPSTSLVIECESLEELKRLYDYLAVNGEVLMPLDTYQRHQQMVWFNDQFGVSWQLVYFGV